MPKYHLRYLAGISSTVKLHHLRDLLAVAEQGSLRAAARQLGIAQPAITRSIQELERDLGVPLFERKARGVTPTAMGDALIRRAKSVNNELLRARDEIEQLRGMTHGTVRVALSMVPHMALLPYTLRPFRVRYPNVHLDIIDAVFPTVASEMIDRTIDCYIGPPPEHLPDGLITEKLFDNTRVILGRKGHPLRQAKSLRELADAEWVTTSITAKAEHELGPLFLQHRLPPPKLVLQAHSALTLIVSLIYSDLLTMLPSQWTTFQPMSDALQTIDVSERLPAPPICIIQRAGLPLTPAAEHFCDLMRRAGAHMGPHAAGQPRLAAKRSRR
jgi:LysR family transcriptional regulator, regulator of abg operon